MRLLIPKKKKTFLASEEAVMASRADLAQFLVGSVVLSGRSLPNRNNMSYFPSTMRIGRAPNIRGTYVNERIKPLSCQNGS